MEYKWSASRLPETLTALLSRQLHGWIVLPAFVTDDFLSELQCVNSDCIIGRLHLRETPEVLFLLHRPGLIRLAFLDSYPAISIPSGLPFFHPSPTSLPADSWQIHLKAQVFLLLSLCNRETWMLCIWQYALTAVTTIQSLKAPHNKQFVLQQLQSRSLPSS